MRLYGLIIAAMVCLIVTGGATATSKPLELTGNKLVPEGSEDG